VKIEYNITKVANTNYLSLNKFVHRLDRVQREFNRISGVDDDPVHVDENYRYISFCRLDA